MAEPTKTITLVIPKKIDQEFKEAVFEICGKETGIIKKCVTHALTLYTKGLRDGTIEPIKTMKEEEEEETQLDFEAMKKEILDEIKEEIIPLIKNIAKEPTPNEVKVTKEIEAPKKIEPEPQ